MKDVDGMLRYENKYLMTATQAKMLECRLEGICLQDVFAGGGGEYRVRSLYFDDYEGSSYWDNMSGTEPRSKFRIRIYNCSPDVIFLEQKIKSQGKVRKERIQVSREFCRQVMEEDWDHMEYPAGNPVTDRFLTAYHIRQLRPKIIVEYDRRAYVYPEGDVRITFDRNVSFSYDREHFFDENIFMRPVMEDRAELLEVKFREFMPDFIYEGISLRQLQQYTFSKYYLCETYRRNEGRTYDI